MHFTKAAATAVGLLGINAAAQGLGQTAICPFDGNRGPNILLAVVELPDGGTEIDAWLYGYNWCSHSNFVSSTGDICSDTGTDRTVEFMHAPFTNKFGAFDPICYANIEIQFYGCEPGGGQNGGFNYDNVVAWITSKPPEQLTNNAVEAAPNFGPQSGRFGQPPQGAFDPSMAGPQGSTGGQFAQNPQQLSGTNNQQLGASNLQQGGGFNPQQQGGGGGGQPPSGFSKRQQSQSQNGQSQSQGFSPAALGSTNSFGQDPSQFQPGTSMAGAGGRPGMGNRPSSFGNQGNFPSQQGSFDPTQQGGGNFDPSQQGGRFNPSQQGNFLPQQQGGFNPQQGGGFNPQQQGNFLPQQQQQQQQGSFGNQQQSPSQFGGQPGQFGGGQQPGQYGGQQQSSYLYQCVDDREHRGCVVNSELNPPSESKYTAFLSCGIMAEP